MYAGVIMKVMFLSSHIRANAASSGYLVRYEECRALAAMTEDEYFFVTPSVKKRLRIERKRITKNLEVWSTCSLGVIKLAKAGFGIYDCLQKILAVLSIKPDLIHVCVLHRPANYLPCVLAKRVYGTRIVETWWELLSTPYNTHGVLPKLVRLYDKAFELRLKKKLDYVLPISTELGKLIHSYNPSVKYSIMHGYISDQLVPQHVDNNTLCHFGISNLSSEDYINYEYLFKVLLHVKCQRRFELIISGSDKEIEELIAVHNLQDLNFRLIGKPNIGEYSRWMSSCDYLLLPLANEPKNWYRWPNKLGDFLLFNRPIIYNPIGELRILSQAYELGYVLHGIMEQDIHLIERLIETSESALNNKIRTEQQELAANLTLQKHTRRLYEIYKSVTDTSADD
jgi:hypothetical protein